MLCQIQAENEKDKLTSITLVRIPGGAPEKAQGGGVKQVYYYQLSSFLEREDDNQNCIQVISNLSVFILILTTVGHAKNMNCFVTSRGMFELYNGNSDYCTRFFSINLMFYCKSSVMKFCEY